MIKGFREFLLRGNVIDLAIAVVIGAAFNSVVNAIANDFLGGLIGAIVGSPDFGRAGVTVNDSRIIWGTTITAAINFFLIAATVYFVIKVPIARLNAWRDDGEDPDPAALTDETRLLTEIRDLLARERDGGSSSPRP